MPACVTAYKIETGRIKKEKNKNDNEIFMKIYVFALKLDNETKIYVLFVTTPTSLMTFG